MKWKEKKKVQIQDYNLDLTTWDEYEVLQTFTCSILATLNSLNVNQQKKNLKDQLPQEEIKITKLEGLSS